MEFLRHLLVALLIFIAGSFFSATAERTTVISDIYFLVGAVGAQVWLFVAAIRLRARHLPRFDMIVASELIIALGILALISGIFISVVFALQRASDLSQFSFEVLQPLLMPFAEGLLAAGFAPVFATVLRQIEVLKYGGSKGDDSTPEAELEGELSSLKDKIREVIVTLDNFLTAYKRSQTVFEKSATSFNKSADAYETTATRLEGALGHLGDFATAKTDQLRAVLDAVNKTLTTYEESLAQSTRQMSDLTDQTRRFQAAANEGATLLGGLRTVIESVERFIRPDR